jgi:hypothetical protein
MASTPSLTESAYVPSETFISISDPYHRPYWDESDSKTRYSAAFPSVMEGANKTQIGKSARECLGRFEISS